MLEKLAEVLDELGGMDPATLADATSIKALHRGLARLEAITTAAAASFETGGAWQAEGARSAAGWLSVRCGVPIVAARCRVALGRSLRSLPATSAAWRAGDIGQAQAAALARARTARTESAMVRDEAMLVARATELRFDSFSRVLAYWSQHADPDGSEAAAADVRAGRRFHLSKSFAGTWVGDVVLDPISGTVVANRLGAIEDELFQADWAEARRRLGDSDGAGEVQPGDLARTPAQRRADALVEMARRAGAADPNGRRPEPLFTVLVGYESFAGRICELADGTVVTPGSLVSWLDQAWVERVVFDGPSRVVDVGVTRRIFAGATRRAVQVRDRECFHELCDVPAEQCEIDHIEPWSAGGLTNQRNGRPGCPFHNRGRHRRPEPPPEE